MKVTPANSTTVKSSSEVLRKRPLDPILQELYEVKAELNAEAGYSVENIVARMRRNVALSKQVSARTAIDGA